VRPSAVAALKLMISSVEVFFGGEHNQTQGRNELSTWGASIGLGDANTIRSSLGFAPGLFVIQKHGSVGKSGGSRQILAIARCTARSPPFLCRLPVRHPHLFLRRSPHLTYGRL
jgi:hypothetical protein